MSRSNQPGIVRPALEHTAQTLEPLGVGIAAGSAAQTLAFARVGLFERQACALRQSGELGPRHFEQPTIGRLGDRLLLDRGVDDHPLELGGLDRTHLHCGSDDGGEQLLDAGFAQCLPEVPPVSRVARQARLKIFLTAEDLVVDVLRPALAHRLVTLGVRVLEVQQADHQPNWQARPTRGTHAAHGMHVASTASGSRRSIIVSRRL